MFKEFREFIERGNVIDLAVAVVIGAAFGKIVTTLVEGILMPPIGMLLSRVDLTGLFYVLDKSKGIPLSVAEAKDKGIPVIAYGSLLNDVVNFIIIAFFIFLVIRAVNRLKSKLDADTAAAAPTTKDCPFCLSSIPVKARRCSECCVDLQTA